MSNFTGRDYGMLIIIAVAGFIAYLALGFRDDANRHAGRVDVLEAALPALGAQRNAALEREAVALAAAAEADTILIHVVDTVKVEIEVAREAAAVADSSFASAVDSLMARVDSTGKVLLTRIVTSHETTRHEDARAFVAQGRELTATKLSLGRSRTLAQERSRVISAVTAERDKFEDVVGALHDQVRSMGRENKVLKWIGGGLIVRAAWEFIAPGDGG